MEQPEKSLGWRREIASSKQVSCFIAEPTRPNYGTRGSINSSIFNKKQENDEAEGKQKPHQRDTNREVQLINEPSMPAR
jgi:hypothetical protein